jgi:hypothetical protein
MTAKVFLDGVELTGQVLEGVSIRYGRQGLDATVEASTCSLSLLALDTEQAAVQLRSVVRVEVDGVTVFRGKVTDRRIELPYISAGRVGTIQQVVATGALAELGRCLVGSVAYPSEIDGARILRVLTEAAPNAPTIDASTGPIDTYPASFNSYASAGIETIDGGTVTLLSRSVDLAKALDVAAACAVSGQAPGLYETPDGRYGYSDARRRSINATPITLPAGIIEAGLKADSRVGDLVNQATVSYGSPEAKVTVDDTFSEYAYGTVAKSISTQLTTAADATDLARRLVTARSQPRLNLDEITVYLDHPDLAPATKTALTGPRFGTPITLTGLDTRIGLGATWQGFIEGWQLVAREGREAITLRVSARLFSLQLATVEELSSSVDRLEGTTDGLAELWAPDPAIDAVADTLNSVAITIDRAYKIGA